MKNIRLLDLEELEKELAKASDLPLSAIMCNHFTHDFMITALSRNGVSYNTFDGHVYIRCNEWVNNGFHEFKATVYHMVDNMTLGEFLEYLD